MLTACSRAGATADAVSPIRDTTAPRAFTVQAENGQSGTSSTPVPPPADSAPPAPDDPPAVIENSGPISIHEDEPNGSFHVELSPSTTPAVRDTVASWAFVYRSVFRSDAARIADARAAALAAAVTAPVVPGATTLVPPTAPPPPPPPTPVTFNAQQVGTPTTPGEVRIQVDEQLDTPAPVTWSIAFMPDVNGDAVLGSGLIAPEAGEAFDAALRGALGGDATEWTHSPGTLTTRDVTFDGQGNLVVRLASWLTYSEGQAKVKLPRDVALPMLSQVGLRVSNGTAAYRDAPDCATQKCVALSYDDGPSQYTAELLDYLDRAKAPATFFMIGKAIQEMPDQARQVAERGYQIGNHTWSHPRLGDLDFGTQAVEVDTTQRLIQDVAGAQSDMLRPPYGNYNDDTRRQNLALMFWNVDTDDWSHRDPAKTVTNAINQVRPGSVILMHDLHHASVIATPYLIARLRGLGYTIVSLDDMFPAREPGAMYRGLGQVEPPLPPTTLPPAPPPILPAPPGTDPVPGPAPETPATPPPGG